ERDDGTPATSVRAGSRVVLRLTAEFRTACAEPVFGFGVKQVGALGSHVIYTINNHQLGVSSGSFSPGEQVEIRIPFTAALMNGHYSVFAMIAARSNGHDGPIFHDWINDLVAFSVDDSPGWEGLAALAAEFRCDAVRPRPAQEQAIPAD